ncbi:hypothetical protein [Tenacibaculum aiptasiae]|uniref:hypothetical protein n=1 Tax=Tenacibaculum aiptasiae TaxID=426481 RepID=UPI0023304E94|nr:hypothetical protein [Tenacibaculum aiptasiae]
MKKEIIAIAILVASGMFTACTDISEDILQNKTQQELEMTGGEEDQDPDEEDEDEELKNVKMIDTGGNDHDPEEEDEDEESKTLKMLDTGGEDEPTPVEDDEDN